MTKEEIRKEVLELLGDADIGDEGSFLYLLKIEQDRVYDFYRVMNELIYEKLAHCAVGYHMTRLKGTNEQTMESTRFYFSPKLRLGMCPD